MDHLFRSVDESGLGDFVSIPLDQIIQQGGPVGFALLFAWLWLKEKADHKETRAALDGLTHKILRKAGVIDNV